MQEQLLILPNQRILTECLCAVNTAVLCEGRRGGGGAQSGGRLTCKRGCDTKGDSTEPPSQILPRQSPPGSLRRELERRALL